MDKDKLRKCPFCGFDEGWTVSSPFNRIENRKIADQKYVVQCYVCGAIGPEGKTHEAADLKWNGFLADVVHDQKRFKTILDEDGMGGGAMGGVSSPMATLNNVPGMGSAVPGSSATGFKGSGDSFGRKLNKKPYTQDVDPKKKKRKSTKKKYVKENIHTIEEENTNPYNYETKIGKLMKGGKTSPFKKRKEKGNQNAIKQQKFEHKIDTFDEFAQRINEGKYAR